MLISKAGRKLSWISPQLTSRTYAELVYPKPINTAHHNLITFLQYSQRTGLDPASTVYVGTHYEYTVADSLAGYGFSLQRTGGASDKGIDLLGTWRPPGAGEALRVILQCKSRAQKLGPDAARELEGAFAGAPAGWRGAGVLGLLIAKEAATKGVRQQLGRSQYPMAYVSCSQSGQVLQMLWNSRAEDAGLRNLSVTTRHTAAGQDASTVVLQRGGEQVP
jgi:hypothetical protein